MKGVPHYGIAGNANAKLQIGDVTIPRYWAHAGLWVRQRFGHGPKDELPLESSGDYTRKLDYTSSSDNHLNTVWYQPEEIFPVNETPEVRQHSFWVPVDKHYFATAKKTKGPKLPRCVNTACLPRNPVVARVDRGISSNVFVDNAVYCEFLNEKFNATVIDMESAADALVCLQQKMPFIAIISLSDLSGGGSSESNEAAVFTTLAARNAVSVLLGFITSLSSYVCSILPHA